MVLFLSRSVSKIFQEPLNKFKQNFQNVLTGLDLCLQLINVWDPFDSRWPPQPVYFWKHINEYNSMNFTDILIRFCALVGGISSQQVVQVLLIEQHLC